MKQRHYRRYIGWVCGFISSAGVLYSTVTLDWPMLGMSATAWIAAVTLTKTSYREI